MVIKIMKLVMSGALVFVLVLLAGCRADTDPIPVTRIETPVAVVTATDLISTPIAVQTETVQLPATAVSPTTTAVQTATALASPTATQTRRPTVTPTVWPPAIYALPEWVDDPNVPVILAEAVPDRDSNTAISLFNVLTGERWDIVENNRYRASFSWDVIDGELSIQLGLGTSTAANYPGPLVIHIAVPDGTVTSTNPEYFGTPSHDGQSLVRFTRDENGSLQTRLVRDYIQGQEPLEGLLLANPFVGRLNDYVTVSWSPDDSYFTTTRVDFPEDRDGDSEYGLAVYRADGQLYRTYDKIYGSGWDPAGSPSILYSVPTASGRAVPCIIDIISSESRCFYGLDSWQNERGVDTYLYRWSPDGKQISLVTYRDPALCLLVVETETVNCLVEADDLIMNEDQFYVVGLDWSPDGRYLSIFMNPQGPGSDDGTSTYLGVVTAEGQDFRVLGETLKTSQTVRLWRPILSASQ